MKALVDTTFLLNTVCRICTWSSWTWALSQMSYNQVEQIALQGPFLLIGIGTWQWMGSLSLLAHILRADCHLTLCSSFLLPTASSGPCFNPKFSLALQFILASCPQKHILSVDFDPRAGFTGQHFDIWGKMILCCRRGKYGVVLLIFKLVLAPLASIMRCQDLLASICSCESPGIECFTIGSVSEEHIAKLVWLVWNNRERDFKLPASLVCLRDNADAHVDLLVHT